MKLVRSSLIVTAMFAGSAMLSIPALSAPKANHGVGNPAREKRLKAWDDLHAKEAAMRAHNQEVAAQDRDARRIAFASHDKAKVAALHAQEAKNREEEAAANAQDRAARTALAAEH